MRKAREHLSEKGYSLPGNNCEHFATYCATGKKKSLQVKGAIGGIAMIALPMIGKIIQKKIKKRRIICRG